MNRKERRLTEYIVLDLEWNQPETPEKAIKKPSALPGEIIQIGAVRLDENAEVTDTFSALIKPVYYTELNEFVSELTHITQNGLSRGIPFCQALDSFIKWCPEKFIFLTWSNSDVKMLRQNIKIHGRSTDWLPVSVDLQALFSYCVVKEKRRYSLTQATAYISGTQFTAHDALNDALATAQLARYMKNDGIDFINPNTSVAAKETNVGSTWQTAKAARRSPENREFTCEGCGKKLSCRWLSAYSNKCYSIARCTCGAEYFVRLTIKVRPDTAVTANRTVSVATAADKEFYKRKQAEEKIKEAKRYLYWHGKKRSAAEK